MAVIRAATVRKVAEKYGTTPKPRLISPALMKNGYVWEQMDWLVISLGPAKVVLLLRIFPLQIKSDRNSFIHLQNHVDVKTWINKLNQSISHRTIMNQVDFISISLLCYIEMKSLTFSANLTALWSRKIKHPCFLLAIVRNVLYQENNKHWGSKYRMQSKSNTIAIRE